MQGASGCIIILKHCSPREVNVKLLQNKIAVITGGTRGIGLAIASAYAQAGAAVVVAGRSKNNTDEAVALLRSQGAQAAGLAVDVTERESVEALAEFALQSYGKLDIWVNNAGTAGPYGPTHEVPPEAFTQVVQTNILGVYHGSLAAVHIFRAQKSGKLINLLGRGYRGPLPYQNAYGSSKVWVRNFTLALAQETRGMGIGVFAFSPGMVYTDLLAQVEVIQGHEKRLKAFPTVVRLLAKPPDFPAQKAVWLASDATDGKTGLVVQASSAAGMLLNAAREGWRALRKQPAPPLDIQIRSIPPYQG